MTCDYDRVIYGYNVVGGENLAENYGFYTIYYCYELSVRLAATLLRPTVATCAP